MVLLTSNLGVVMSLTGNVAGSTLGYILPGFIALSPRVQAAKRADAAIIDASLNRYWLLVNASFIKLRCLALALSYFVNVLATRFSDNVTKDCPVFTLSFFNMFCQEPR